MVHNSTSLRHALKKQPSIWLCLLLCWLIVTGFQTSFCIKGCPRLLGLISKWANPRHSAGLTIGRLLEWKKDLHRNIRDINDFNHILYSLFRRFFFGNTQNLLVNLSPDKDLSKCNFVRRYTPPEPAACSCSQVLYAKKILSIVSKWTASLLDNFKDSNFRLRIKS